MRRIKHDKLKGIGNRVVSKSAKRCLMWCDNCDSDLVVPGKKCGTCGIRNDGHLRKRDKE